MRLLGLLLAGLLLAAPAPAFQAQESVRFDPSRDLEGFDACFDSEFRDIYPIEEYSSLLAREMKPAELAEVQKRWKADLAAAEEKLAKLRADPVEESVWLLVHRLRKSSYFSKIDWVEDRSVPGFVLLVQKLSPDLPGYGAKMAQKYGPWLEKVASVFDETCKKPLGLERRKGRALAALAILSSKNQYETFWQVHPNHVSTAPFACYDLRLGIAVGYDDPFRPVSNAVEARTPMLNAVVRGLIDEHASAKEGRPDSLWIEEGLARYVSEHEGDEPSGLDQRYLRSEAVRSLMAFARDPNKGPLLIHPIENLVDLKASEDVDRIVVSLWRGMRSLAPTPEEVRTTYFGQSMLWMHFLLDGKSGALRAPTRAYLKSAFAGDGGSQALAKAFAGKDFAAIDRDFLAWFADAYRAAGPDGQGGPPAIDRLFERHGRVAVDPKPAASSAGTSKAGTSKPGAEPAKSPKEPAPAIPAPAVGGLFSPAALAPGPADVAARHGLALLRARTGDLEPAIATLDELSRADIDPEERARIARDLSRVGELAKLRVAFFESFRSSGSKWTMEVEGKKLPVKVDRIEDGFVYFTGTRAPEKLALASFPPADIAKQASDKGQRGDTAPWARAYAMLLAGDKNWERYVRDDSEETNVLREDAKSWLPGRIQEGVTGAAMESLSKKSLPTTPAEGEALFATIKALVAANPESELVKIKRPLLRRLGELAAEQAVEKADVGALLRGKYTALGEGRAKLVYDFQDPLQATDFVKTKGYLVPWREAQPFPVAPEAESSWEVKEGTFVGIGGACYRLPVEFGAPMSVKYRVRVLEGKAQNESVVSFGVGICDDGHENVILALGFGDLLVRDTRGPGGAVLRMPREFPWNLKTSYNFEVKHDGSNTTTAFEGQKGHEAPTPAFKSGQVILWFHSNLPVAVERIEIEGRLVPTVFPELKQAGIDRMLAEVGFQ